MKYRLYEYGIDLNLEALLRILRGAMGNKLSKRDKDVRIAEAIGIVDTLERLLIVESKEEGDSETNEQNL